MPLYKAAYMLLPLRFAYVIGALVPTYRHGGVVSLARLMAG
jgi:hypothetical protein